MSGADISHAKAAAQMEKPDTLELISKYRLAIMGFAALWILVFHEWQSAFTEVPGLMEIERGIRLSGYCGVDIFLLLSGIGLTYSVGRGSLGSFYARRFERVLPPFLIVAIIVAFAKNWGLEKFLLNVSGINMFTKYIYSWQWYVTAIICFYLAFPWYYRVFLKAKNKLLFLVGFIALWLLLSFAFAGGSRDDLYGFTNRIPIFFTGVYFGWFSQNKKLPLKAPVWIVATVSMLAGLYLSYMILLRDMQLLLPEYRYGLPDFLITMGLPLWLAKILDVLSTCKPLKWLGKGLTKFLAFFGSMSLEFYCVQEPLSEAIIPTLYEWLGSPLLVNAAVFVCVTAAGYALYRLIELGKKLLKRKK